MKNVQTYGTNLTFDANFLVLEHIEVSKATQDNLLYYADTLFLCIKTPLINYYDTTQVLIHLLRNKSTKIYFLTGISMPIEIISVRLHFPFYNRPFGS